MFGVVFSSREEKRRQLQATASRKKYILIYVDGCSIALFYSHPHIYSTIRDYFVDESFLIYLCCCFFFSLFYAFLHSSFTISLSSTNYTLIHILPTIRPTFTWSCVLFWVIYTMWKTDVSMQVFFLSWKIEFTIKSFPARDVIKPFVGSGTRREWWWLCASPQMCSRKRDTVE